MSVLHKEQLNGAFSALKNDTRKTVIEELESALRDTSMEYHRTTDPSISSELWRNIQGLDYCIKSLKQVQEEFDEISSRSNDVDGGERRAETDLRSPPEQSE